MIGDRTPEQVSEDIVNRIIAADITLEEVREVLLSQVRGCISDCNGAVEGCARECTDNIEARIAGIVNAHDATITEAELLTRGNLERLNAELLDLGGQVLPLAGDEGQDTPPGGGGGYEFCGDTCRDRNSPPISCTPAVLMDLIYWDEPSCQWAVRDFDFTTTLPWLLFGDPAEYTYEGYDGRIYRGTVPPRTTWARGIRRLLPIQFTCRHNVGECTYTVRFTGSTRQGSETPSSTRPPGGTPPQPPEPPPPRPPIEPPPGPPGTEPPTEPPPPGREECSWADPCYPHVPRVVQQYRRTVPPLPVTYYIRVRCLDGCTADVECWEAWCPPDDGSGWIVVGPYQFCPPEGEIDRIIRYYCRLGEPPGREPRTPGVPPPEEPPTNPPPPPDPPPPEEQCKAQMIHPPRWQATSPICMDESKWIGPMMGGIDAHDDIEETLQIASRGLSEPSGQSFTDGYFPDLEEPGP